MAGFSLTKGADKYDFDVAGAVNKNSQPVGVWTASKDNKLVVNDNNGNALASFDVTWQFNADNQIILGSGGNPASTFPSVAGLRPMRTPLHTVLNARPA